MFSMAPYFKTDRVSLFGNWRCDMHAAIFEFIGTTFFLLFGLGGCQAAMTSVAEAAQAAAGSGAGAALASGPSVSQLFYCSTSLGFSLLVSAWLFFRVTGGVFNPAVSTALLLINAISPLRFVLYCIAQLSGSIAASAILAGLTPQPISVQTTLGEGMTVTKAVFLEMFLTAALVLAVLMLAAEKHKARAVAPIGIGLTLFIGHLFGVKYTGASMNTARSFGPAVLGGFHSYHWVYWLGPFLGSLVATAFYKYLKHIQYWNLGNCEENPVGPSNCDLESTSSSCGSSRTALAADEENAIQAVGKEGSVRCGTAV